MNARSVIAAAGLAASTPLASPAQFDSRAVQPATHITRNDGDALCAPGDGCGKARAAAARFRAGLHPQEDPVGYCMAADAAELTDLLHCNLDIEIIPSTTTIAGSNTFTIKSKVDGLSTFTFRLRNQFTITSALINGVTPVQVSAPTISTRIAALDRPYNSGETFTLTINYSGVPVSFGFGSIQFSTQNGDPIVYTLSEPYYAYTWWPCKDGDDQADGDNSDKFTADVAITAPQTMKSVSNGLLQGIDAVHGGRSRYRWATSEPTATYLIFFSSTAYNQWSQTYTYPGGTMPVEFSIFPANDTPANRAAWELSLTVLATYRTVFGEYPFTSEKYGIYNFNFNGGEEHQTYTGQGTFIEWVTAHELAHQWWGDNITCKTWHDIWLNEGFATYAEALWEERKPGSTGLPALIAAMASRRPFDLSGTVYCTDVSGINTIFSNDNSYRKGGWVLHQLRHVVGDATFFNILAAYRAAYQRSVATTDNFAAVASAVYGQDLSWFFQEWVYGPGAPWYGASWQNLNINGQNYLRLRLRQMQTSQYPLFTMPVDIRVNFASGNQTYVVWSDALDDWFVIPIPAAPTGIVVDENKWILTLAQTASGPAVFPAPPKILAASPAPDAVLASGSAPSTVTIAFTDTVTIPTGALTLHGPSGPIPVVVSFNTSTLTATLAAAGPLPPGNYTVTARDTITSIGLALDGEIHPPHSTSNFPSGNGTPGGNAVWSFTIAPPTCYANCDASTLTPLLNVNDYICFSNRFAAGDSYANCDASTVTPILNVNDFICFSNRFTAGCQ